MKHLFSLILVAILSAVMTVAVDNYFEKDDTPPSIIVREQAPLPAPTYNDLTQPAAVPIRQNNRRMTTAPTDFTKGAARATPAVVHIRAFDERTSSQFFDDFWSRSSDEVSSGSGVIISPDGYVVTNNHVIEEGNKFEITLDGQQSLAARVIGRDPSTDLALIKVEANDLPYLNFADSDGALTGEWVLAVGNPFNLNSTVTAGIISAKGRNINILEDTYSIESFIQTDAAVNPGNSGGALVDTNGDLIGINTAIITRSGRYEGYSFAVPSNLVKKVVNDLREYGTVQRGFLGVNIRDISDEIAEDLRLSSRDGVYLARINPNSAAEDAGLKVSDIIVGINGAKVKDTPALQEQVGQHRPGDKLVVDYIRAGEYFSVDLILKNRNNNPTLMSKENLLLMSDLGLDIRDLNRGELRAIGVDGVRVTSIVQGSIIDRTNMQPNFIITRVNDVRVKDTETFTSLINKAKGKVTIAGFYENYPDVYFYNFEK